MPFVSKAAQGKRRAKVLLNPTCWDKGQPKLYLDSPFGRTGSIQGHEPTLALPCAYDANAAFRRNIRGPHQLIARLNPEEQMKDPFSMITVLWAGHRVWH